MMICPKCQSSLEENLLPQSLVVDDCPKCKGRWLDLGELTHFIKDKKILAFFEKTGLKDLESAPENCPRCRVGLMRGTFPYYNFKAEECPSCKGLWLDREDLDRLLEIAPLPKVKIKVPPKVLAKPFLPSLGSTALWVFLSLYALLFGVIVLFVQLGLLNYHLGLFIAVAYVFLQFLLGPTIMDWSLRLIGSLDWVDLEELPPHLKDFIKDQCLRHHIPIPRIGLIRDGAPQAYTYGCTPYNARLVLSQGLIDILEPEEREAVVAHELGHIVHWDFLLMTLAQLVPILLYHLYRLCVDMGKKKGGGSKGRSKPVLIAAVIAYCAYLISQYLLLFLSRIREYWADYFSVRTTRNPMALIGALSKIAFGLVASDNEKQENNESDSSQEKRKAAVQALGVMNISTAKEMALYSSQPLSGGVQDLKEIMRWDLWNPWATLYEWQSTHPLTAKRINAIAKLGQSLGIDSSAVFDLPQKESYLDDFFKDLLVYLAPLLGALLVAGFFYKQVDTLTLALYASVGLSLGGMLKVFLSYPQHSFLHHSVSTLLKNVKVSPVKAIPVTLRGTILGRGQPGNIFSEDLVLKDKTGLIFLDYEQPLAIMNIFFALTKAKRFAGEEVKVEGWYRRGPIPYVEIRSIRSPKDESFSYLYHMKLLGWTLFPFFVWFVIHVINKQNG